ncbi:17987_t:CDS:2 [Cetraspora pellucida]|uniref:17987_t:CDS:1 n=1 Tax=Cetraspora pellucida TaxID=1433469 RepID=A0ACA9JYA8_9GLOM|nr:17987_t:CDS:2 [Cetraspora pellucida]
MNKFFVIFVLFAVSTVYSSEDYYSSDKLSGFKNCPGNYSVKFTSFSYSPSPIVKEGMLSMDISGETEVAIGEGASIIGTAYYNGYPINSYPEDFCEGWVRKSGSECPILPGKFSCGTTIFVYHGQVKNVVLSFDMTIIIVNNDSEVEACMEGVVSAIQYD